MLVAPVAGGEKSFAVGVQAFDHIFEDADGFFGLRPDVEAAAKTILASEEKTRSRCHR